MHHPTFAFFALEQRTDAIGGCKNLREVTSMPKPETAVSILPPALWLAMRPLPLWPLQPLLAMFVDRVRERHPDIFNRLGEHSQKRFGLNPTDLPFVFVLEPSRSRPVAVAMRQLPSDLDARISGRLGALLGLVSGEFDGDALFFSREIRIEGDMEAVLALRNAIDGVGVDLLGEFFTELLPFAADRLWRGRPPRPSHEGGTRREARPWN
jgi:predicted lipid carrier protein YhbT